MFGNMETDHVMLTSRGANLFAERIGFKTVPADTLVTDYEKREWEKPKEYVVGVKELFRSQWYVMENKMVHVTQYWFQETSAIERQKLLLYINTSLSSILSIWAHAMLNNV